MSVSNVKTTDLRQMFIVNRELGVPFSVCFMLVLKQAGYTQSQLMARVGRLQPELSQYLNGHRSQTAPIPVDVRTSCVQVLGFDPWLIDGGYDDGGV